MKEIQKLHQNFLAQTNINDIYESLATPHTDPTLETLLKETLQNIKETLKQPIIKEEEDLLDRWRAYELPNARVTAYKHGGFHCTINDEKGRPAEEIHTSKKGPYGFRWKRNKYVVNGPIDKQFYLASLPNDQSPPSYMRLVELEAHKKFKDSHIIAHEQKIMYEKEKLTIQTATPAKRSGHPTLWALATYQTTTEPDAHLTTLRLGDSCGGIDHKQLHGEDFLALTHNYPQDDSKQAQYELGQVIKQPLRELNAQLKLAEASVPLAIDQDQLQAQLINQGLRSRWNETTKPTIAHEPKIILSREGHKLILGADEYPKDERSQRLEAYVTNWDTGKYQHTGESYITASLAQELINASPKVTSVDWFTQPTNIQAKLYVLQYTDQADRGTNPLYTTTLLATDEHDARNFRKTYKELQPTREIRRTTPLQHLMRKQHGISLAETLEFAPHTTRTYYEQNKNYLRRS